MNPTIRSNFFPGLTVKIILNGGKIVEGKVKEVLTIISIDPAGIFVKLETNESGNVIEILQTDSEIEYNTLKSELIRNLELDEIEEVEFKETFHFPTDPEKNLSEISKQDKKKILFSIAKIISAYANTNGGILYIGIQDRTKIIKGLERDYQFLQEGKQDADGLEVRLKSDLPAFFERGERIFEYIKLRFIKFEQKDVCILKVTRSDIALIPTFDSKDHFFVRSGGSSLSYSGTKFVDYWIKHVKEIF